MILSTVILVPPNNLWQKAGFKKAFSPLLHIHKQSFNTINNARQTKKSYKIKFICIKKNLKKVTKKITKNSLTPANKSDNYNINYIWMRAWRAIFLLSLPAQTSCFERP